ncbi:MAG: hypothetical protein BroJett003_01770 [Planctomycetota bacterium]|nr:MAG: hypothetical protein BroJett003_01770 [Planctomycetota bacterium]
MFVFFSMMVWAMFLGWIIPKAYRFAVNNPDAVKGGIASLRRMFGR